MGVFALSLSLYLSKQLKQQQQQTPKTVVVLMECGISQEVALEFLAFEARFKGTGTQMEQLVACFLQMYWGVAQIGGRDATLDTSQFKWNFTKANVSSLGTVLF